MSVNLGTASPRTYSVGRADDPYKKYWWAILAGFGLTGAWLCLPVMDSSIGSARIDTSKPPTDAGGEQSLDSRENPSGAPGLNLSMDGMKKHGAKGDEFVPSMLYQAAPDAPGALKDGAPFGSATGSAGASSASGSLADQLKKVGAKDASGWAEKAQRGFDAPKLGGSGMSGLGSVGGGSSAMASAGGVSAFGARNSEVGFGSAKGLRDDGGGAIGKGTQASMGALKDMSKAVTGAAGARSGDTAVASLNHAFDGAAKNGAIGPAGAAAGGSYEALDQAPVNLKLNDPKLDAKEMKEPPPSAMPSNAKDSAQQMAQQMGMMLATAVVGGMIPGAGGQMAMMMGMMMMQQQQAAAADARAQKQQQCVSSGRKNC